LRQQNVKIFKDNNLGITSTANLSQVQFLDVTLDLKNEIYKPYIKPVDKPTVNQTILTVLLRTSTPPLRTQVNLLDIGRFSLTNSRSPSLTFNKAKSIIDQGNQFMFSPVKNALKPSKNVK
jgi:hypothetical protein